MTLCTQLTSPWCWGDIGFGMSLRCFFATTAKAHTITGFKRKYANKVRLCIAVAGMNCALVNSSSKTKHQVWPKDYLTWPDLASWSVQTKPDYGDPFFKSLKECVFAVEEQKRIEVRGITQISCKTDWYTNWGHNLSQCCSLWCFVPQNRITSPQSAINHDVATSPFCTCNALQRSAATFIAIVVRGKDYQTLPAPSSLCKSDALLVALIL